MEVPAAGRRERLVTQEEFELYSTIVDRRDGRTKHATFGFLVAPLAI